MALATATAGCGVFDRIKPGPHDTVASYHDDYAMRIEYPEVRTCSTSTTQAAEQAIEPMSLEDPSKIPALELSLEEAIQLAVQQSPVLRSIGGTIVANPQGAKTVYDPALAHANPLSGPEAALSAFDAQWTSALFWNKNDAPQNSPPAPPGFPAALLLQTLQQTAATSTNQLSKQTANGASFALRHNVNYLRTNQFVGFPSVYTGYLEAEWRQPLLQGSGTTFNRIAGPNSPIGQYNGVLIARVNEDVALADFEAAVVDLVADVEQAYWDLVVSYRILEANVKGRDAALQTFQYQQVRLEAGAGRSDEEAQAQSQYYQFRAQVEQSLGGTTGLYALEQKLRYLIGLPATDGRLIRPMTEPTDVRVVFDWESALGQALTRRVEVRRERFNVQKREMELTAARLNRRPQLDFLGLYRWRGLGDELISDKDGDRDNLYGSITGGNYQEWQAGIEFNMPVGLRQASVAFAHAKLNLQRERAVLAETELRISHDLSDAARQIALTHQLLETNYDRYQADLRQVDVLRRRYKDGTDNINFLLQAQRQVVTSESEFYRALTNYNVAIRDFHKQKGSLLAYNQVQLAEGQWAAGAYRDAYEVGRHLTPRIVSGETCMPRPLTSGPFDPAAPQASMVPVQGMPYQPASPSDVGEFLEATMIDEVN
ncbi:Outer membrane efflux protein [Planctomycetes bacterium CA13]|uniref:Outer membrane efflux protein n=2 Tax=Novipirellula herctigrandis TaxID=2527986 RepID=A0A5C5Z0G6_9BACT|nr:Outer membrane efflux protein [Planctomycetes bacterium CA13]